LYSPKLIGKISILAFIIAAFQGSAFSHDRDSLASIHYKRYLKQRAVKLYTPAYLEWKKGVMKEFEGIKAGHFGEFVKGTYDCMVTKDSVIALTFDACTGTKNDYNFELIRFLKKENIPATLFVSGLWIDYNAQIFRQLSEDPLFDLENHGLNHRLCSITGAEKFGITGTANVGEVIDEMELNSRKMEKLTGRKPVLFRTSTIFTDEASTKIAQRLELKMIGYSVLSGDVDPNSTAVSICANIVRNAKPGSIVIMHFNHPKWKERQALELAIPILRKKGYRFVKLKDYQLKGK